MSSGVGHRRGLDPVLLWLWHRPAATAPIRPLAWEHTYSAGAALKRHKKWVVGDFHVCLQVKFPANASGSEKAIGFSDFIRRVHKGAVWPQKNNLGSGLEQPFFFSHHLLSWQPPSASWAGCVAYEGGHAGPCGWLCWDSSHAACACLCLLGALAYSPGSPAAFLADLFSDSPLHFTSQLPSPWLWSDLDFCSQVALSASGFRGGQASAWPWGGWHGLEENEIYFPFPSKKSTPSETLY